MKVYHGVRKVYHGVQWTSGLAGLGGQGTIYKDKTTNKHTDTSLTRTGLRAGQSKKDKYIMIINYVADI